MAVQILLYTVYFVLMFIVALYPSHTQKLQRRNKSECLARAIQKQQKLGLPDGENNIRARRAEEHRLLI